MLTGLLAAIGVYGLLAWSVNERRRELAIRLALGAQPASLARLVTSQGLGLAPPAWSSGCARSSRAACCRRCSSGPGRPTRRVQARPDCCCRGRPRVPRARPPRGAGRAVEGLKDN